MQDASVHGWLTKNTSRIGPVPPASGTRRSRRSCRTSRRRACPGRSSRRSCTSLSNDQYAQSFASIQYSGMATGPQTTIGRRCKPAALLACVRPGEHLCIWPINTTSTDTLVRLCVLLVPRADLWENTCPFAESRRGASIRLTPVCPVPTSRPRSDVRQCTTLACY